MSVHVKLAEARAKVLPVVRKETADTGKYSYSYASIGAVMEAVDKACHDVGLAWWQRIEVVDGGWQLVTDLCDIDAGEVRSFGGPVNTTKPDPQANGSALTYARRYALVTLFGLNQEDDDGGAAHRSVVLPGQRTEAEKQVRKIIEGLPDAMAKEDAVADFKEVFGCTLTNLPEHRHGDALTWMKAWLTERTTPPAPVTVTHAEAATVMAPHIQAHMDLAARVAHSEDDIVDAVIVDEPDLFAEENSAPRMQNSEPEVLFGQAARDELDALIHTYGRGRFIAWCKEHKLGSNTQTWNDDTLQDAIVYLKGQTK